MNPARRASEWSFEPPPPGQSLARPNSSRTNHGSHGCHRVIRILIPRQQSRLPKRLVPNYRRNLFHTCTIRELRKILCEQSKPACRAHQPCSETEALAGSPVSKSRQIGKLKSFQKRTLVFAATAWFLPQPPGYRVLPQPPGYRGLSIRQLICRNFKNGFFVREFPS